MLPDKKQALHELFLTSLLTEQNMEDHEMVDDFEEPAYNALMIMGNNLRQLSGLIQRSGWMKPLYSGTYRIVS